MYTMNRSECPLRSVAPILRMCQINQIIPYTSGKMPYILCEVVIININIVKRSLTSTLLMSIF